tara:strand:+ start:920 stop:1039 length:120 start_codon:yes stop_codon:yes gene_type:complete
MLWIPYDLRPLLPQIVDGGNGHALWIPYDLGLLSPHWEQ